MSDVPVTSHQASGQDAPQITPKLGEPALEQHLRLTSQILGGLVALQGILVLIGWAIGNETLKGSYVSGINVKTNAAIALALAGLALILLAPRRRPAALTWIGRIFAVSVVLIGLATLFEHFTGMDLGIDEALFTEPLGAAATASPNRMGPPASICLPLLAMAVLLMDWKRRGRALHQHFAIAVLLIALIPILGYIYRVHELYGVARFTGIALSTALCFGMLSVGILFARPEGGPVRLLVAQEAGGMVVRRLLPAALLVPIVLGWVYAAFQDLGWYDAQFSRTILTLTFIVIFSILIWWNGAGISQLSAARARAEAAERELTLRLVEALEGERNAREAAEQANRMKDEFLAMLSHELRTPLNAILGWANVLQMGSHGEPELRRGLETIQRNSRLQARLIDDLLDMSRIVSGKIHLEARPIDLEQIVDAAILAIAPTADARGVRVERAIEPSAGEMMGDPVRLQQVLWNLLSNAVKFTPRGGRARVTLRRDGSEVELSVSDTGMGIPQHLISRIFEPFRQADASTTRRQGGLGLGLSIAKRLVELHGGSIQAESDGEGRGSTFTVRLPAERRSVAAELPVPGQSPESVPERRRPVPVAVDAASGNGPGEPTRRLSNLRVMVVDDHADGRELAERILRGQGAQTVAVESADVALETLEKESFDLLVCDIAMPGRDGYDLIREVRRRFSDLPAIALTALTHEGHERLALEAGYQKHLSKPVDPERLVKTAAELTAARRVAPGTAPVVP